MPRRRWIIALLLFALLLVGAEITLRHWQSPKACVQIINKGTATMEDVVVHYNGTTVPLGNIAMDASSMVWVTAGPKGILKLDFQQKGNALKGFQVVDFDPMQNIRDSFKLVLLVKPKQIERFVEDDEFQKSKESLLERFRQWMRTEFESDDP
ncbi:MAG: hypothetical protein ACLQGP_23335 [Isosphaeraceae bacterium]